MSSTGLGILAEGYAKIALEYIPDIHEKLFVHGFVGAKQFRVLFIHPLDPGLTGHACSCPLHNGSHGIPRHHAGQEEIKYEGKNKSDQEPE